MSYKLFTQRVGLIGVTNLLVGFSGIILLPILTKTLSIHDYGAWVQVIVTLGLASSIAILGLNGAMVRFLPGGSKGAQRDMFFSMICIVFIVGLIISVAMILMPGIIAQIVGNEKIVPILALIVPVYCVNLMFLTFFMAIGQMKRYSLFLLLQTYGDVLLVAYLVQYGVIGAVSAILFVRIALFVLMSWYVIKELGFSIPTFSRTREHLNYSVPLIPTGFSGWVVSSSDRYLILFFLGLSYVGIYSPGYALGTIIFMFLTPILAVLTPTISKLYEEDKRDEARQYLSYALKYFLALAIPSVMGLTILSKQMLIILTTGEIAAQGYPITPFVALGVLFYGVSGINGQVLMLAKKTRIIGATAMSAAFANFILNIIFIPQIGIVGAAFTTLITYALMTAIITYFSSKYFTLGIDWTFILKSIAASVVMSIVILRSSPVKTIEVLFTIAFGAGIYFCALYLLKGFRKEEIEFFREMLKI